MVSTLVEPVQHIRPGKAQVYLDPRANALLEQAIALYGQPIFPTGSGSAGRTQEQQQFYYDRFRYHGGPVAANPNWGRRPHMRFGAIDIDDPGARAAMEAAGWVATTPSEWWHFEHPDMVRNSPLFSRWPIVTSIHTNTPPSKRRRNDMDAYVIGRVDKGQITEVSLCHPTLVGPTAIERGYIVVRAGTTVTGESISLEDAMTAAARAHGLGLSIVGVNGGDRATYVAGQELARNGRAQYLRDRGEFAAEIARALPQGSSNAEMLAAIAKVPTAEQNGTAARAAIVK